MIRFERMTVFCEDLENSLAFYRDGLGLMVVEEKVLEGAAAGALLQLPPCRIRIAMLAPDQDEAVILGLFEISATDLDGIRPPRGRPLHGQTALVIRTRNFAELARRLAATGAAVLTQPLSYPKPQASTRSPAGIYREMIVYDPDGVLVSILRIDPLPAGGPA